MAGKCVVSRVQSSLSTSRAEFRVLVQLWWEINVNEFVPACVPLMEIAVAKSRMSGPPVHQFLAGFGV